MSTFVVTKASEWRKANPGVKKHVPGGEPTPFPFEQESAHWQWFNPRWTLCHGYVHGQAHAWIEYKDVVVDLFVPGMKRLNAKLKVSLSAAYKTVKSAGMKESSWQKKFKSHAQGKDRFYQKYKPTKVKRYNLMQTCMILDELQQYGDWELKLGPSARQRFMSQQTP